MGQGDYDFMQQAIALARKCHPEDGRPHPKVGAVVARDGQLLGGAYRGEKAEGDHAEYTVLERKLPNEDLAGATLYVTLDPCTERSKEKTPCVYRVIDRGIKRVFIGMLDPNPDIARGRGLQRLRAAGIEVAFFPTALMEQLEDLNRDFIASFPLDQPAPMAAPAQPRGRIDFGEGDDLSFAGFVAAYSSPDAASPSCGVLHLYLDSFRLLNLDVHPTTADRLWVTVDGQEPKEILENSWRAGESQIPARTSRRFTLHYVARYSSTPSPSTNLFVLHQDLLGLGTIASPLPQWLFKNPRL